jgi:phosphoserine phosphatase RsbU/P
MANTAETHALQQLTDLCTELTTQNTVLYERNKAIEKELYSTRQLQQSLLPSFLPDDRFMAYAKCHHRDEYSQISGVYLPCDSVGGDLYDIIRLRPSEPYVGISVSDVSGHGVPASFITAIYKATLYRITHNAQDPGQVMYELNNELADIVKTGDYVTAIYGRLFDCGTRFEFAGAGHPYPLHYRKANHTVTPLMENGTPLTWLKDMVYTTQGVTLAPGDKVLIYTDGVTEMKNQREELFGEDRLKATFLACQNSELPLLDTLLSELSDFAACHPLDDDLSMVLIEINP